MILRWVCWYTPAVLAAGEAEAGLLEPQSLKAALQYRTPSLFKKIKSKFYFNF